MKKKVNKEIRDRIIKLSKEIEEKQVEIRKLIDSFVSGPYWLYDVDSFWGCLKSPFGLCTYHRIKDPAHDHCIFCGQPQERK